MAVQANSTYWVGRILTTMSLHAEWVHRPFMRRSLYKLKDFLLKVRAARGFRLVRRFWLVHFWLVRASLRNRRQCTFQQT